MAYGNWGAFVYRGMDRAKYREDAPISEDSSDIYHAILGDHFVRLCGYKNYPMLFVDGREVELEPFLISQSGDEREYSGEIYGYKFEARQFDGCMLDLTLIEPEGTKWWARCGYCYGAGWDE